MSKLKKIYCAVSFAFAALMICAALLLSHPGIVRAASTETASGRDAEDIGSLNVTSTPGEGEKSTSDNNNGLHIIYNNDEGSVSADIKIFLVITIIALAPSILIMLTSYTRIIIVLHFLRSAIGTQTSPPNQVLIGLALFLTIFIMQPVFTQVNENAIKPLDAGEITQEEAFEAGWNRFGSLCLDRHRGRISICSVKLRRSLMIRARIWIRSRQIFRILF